MLGRIHIYNHRLQVRWHAGWLSAIEDLEVVKGGQTECPRRASPCIRNKRT